jgi:hypothetical protein
MLPWQQQQLGSHCLHVAVTFNQGFSVLLEFNP